MPIQDGRAVEAAAVLALAMADEPFSRWLLPDRDEFIAKKIAAVDGKKVLAVLGAGHLNGVKQHLADLEGSVQVSYNLTVGGVAGETEGVEVKQAGVGVAKKIKLIGYLVPAIFLAIMAYSLMTHGGELTLDLLLKWFLINGTLSALGTALGAPEHPMAPPSLWSGQRYGRFQGPAASPR